MNELLNKKYAELLIKKGVNLQKNQQDGTHKFLLRKLLNSILYSI